MTDADQKGPWPLRSLLFVPAHREDWVAKSTRFAPDALILDLEDAVAPDVKPAARKLVPSEIDAAVAMGCAPIVRLNALDEGADLDLPHVVRPGLAAVMLPKVNGPEDIAALDALLAAAEQGAGLAAGSIRIIALPETARGLWLAWDIASASPRVVSLMTSVSGPSSGDVAKAFGYQPSMGGEEQLFLQSRTILACRAAGAAYPLAAVFGTDIEDLGAVETLTRRARRLGFSGVAVIHPSHVEIVNRVFSPTPEEVDHARALLDALDAAHAAGSGAVRFRGKMIDAAMAADARDLLEEHRRRSLKAAPGAAASP